MTDIRKIVNNTQKSFDKYAQFHLHKRQHVKRYQVSVVYAWLSRVLLKIRKIVKLGKNI